jgi:hypothetical protein
MLKELLVDLLLRGGGVSGIFATSMIAASGLVCCGAASGASRSHTITPASLIASSPATVSSPAPPGLPPTKITVPTPAGCFIVTGEWRNGWHTMITSRRRNQLVTLRDTSGRHNQSGVAESSRAARRRRMINSPRAASSATVAPISGATTVTTAPESSRPRIADSAAGHPPQTSTGSPFSSTLAEKAAGGTICVAARGYHWFTQLLMPVGPELDTRPTAQT